MWLYRVSKSKSTMIVSKTTVSLMCVLVVMSVILAHFFSMISTDQNRDHNIKDESLHYTNYLTDKYGMITDTPKNLIWFLQISDIHISIFRDPGRISQFQQFCDSTVKIIKPLVVLASGDLTDAKAKDNLGSSQVKTEWIYYHNIIKESGVTEYTQWLDIRGNHDNFNIKTIEDKENYFRNFSVQGKKSYVHYADSNGVNVAFLGIDACPEPGLRRPFNFIGIIDGNEQQSIRKLKSEANSKADHIVWFGHYPTSCILSLDLDSQRLDIRQTIGETTRSQVYLCGHLHSMGGLVTQMYTKHKRGFLELELGDWKDNRIFRLGAIDHGMFSFVDTKINTWPLVLVTNPKEARYNMPGKEPLKLMLQSTHVRILVFSDAELTSVKISYDKISWIKCKHKAGPLYTVLWLPHLFKKGLHKMYVSVTDDFKRETIVEHQFALDDSIVKFDVTARILLMLDAGAVFQSLFATLLFVNVMPLIILRAQKRPPRNRRRLGHFLVRRMWLLCKINHIFYPLVLYSIYLAFGPWAIGELIDGYTGAIFAWGILIRGVYLPESFTYLYGSVQIMFVQIPLVFVLTHCLNMRLFCNDLKGFKKVVKNLPFIFLLTIQLLLAYFFWLEYGTMSFLLGPLRTWSIVLSVTLWFKLWTLPLDYCRNLIKLDELQPL